MITPLRLLGHGRMSCRAFSTSTARRILPLAYKLHEPPKKSAEADANLPIVFMHGFFGSKQNNRSISKYEGSPLQTLPCNRF
jgi:hypothetical protein